MSKIDKFMEYMVVTGQVDQFFNLKNIVKCPNCKEELYIYKKNLLYCKKCKEIIEYNEDKPVHNMKLTYNEIKEIK